MMASEIFEFDAAWAEKWTKTGVPFLSAPTVKRCVFQKMRLMGCCGFLNGDDCMLLTEVNII